MRSQKTVHRLSSRADLIRSGKMVLIQGRKAVSIQCEKTIPRPKFADEEWEDNARCDMRRISLEEKGNGGQLYIAR
jgi:hypothetical protein